MWILFFILVLVLFLLILRRLPFSTQDKSSKTNLSVIKIGDQYIFSSRLIKFEPTVLGSTSFILLGTSKTLDKHAIRWKSPIHYKNKKNTIYKGLEDVRLLPFTSPSGEILFTGVDLGIKPFSQMVLGKLNSRLEITEIIHLDTDFPEKNWLPLYFIDKEHIKFIHHWNVLPNKELEIVFGYFNIYTGRTQLDANPKNNNYVICGSTIPIYTDAQRPSFLPKGPTRKRWVCLVHQKYNTSYSRVYNQLWIEFEDDGTILFISDPFIFNPITNAESHIEFPMNMWNENNNWHVSLGLGDVDFDIYKLK